MPATRVLNAAAIGEAGGATAADLAGVQAFNAGTVVCPPATGIDDTSTLTTFFANVQGKRGFIPPGTYQVKSLISSAFNNTTIYAIPGTVTIQGDFDYRVIRLRDCSNAHFYGINFKTTYVNAVEDGTYAVVYSLLANVFNCSFRRCGFSAPNANTSGINIFPRTLRTDNAKSVDGLWIEECNFEDIGRICCTVMNRGVDAPNPHAAFQRFYFNRNRAKNIGTVNSTYGFLLSLDGYGQIFTVNDNYMENLLDIGIENIAFSNGEICRNKGSNFSRGWKMLSIDAGGFSASFGITAKITGLEIAGNKMVGDVTGSRPSNFFDMVSDCVVHDNYLKVESTNAPALGGGVYAGQAVSLRRCENVRFMRETWINSDPAGKYVALIETASKFNEFIDCTFNNAACTSQFSVLRFSGSGTARNTVHGRTRMIKGTGGSYVDEVISAVGTAVEPYDDGTGTYISGYKTLTMSDADTTLPDLVAYDFIDISGTLTATRTLTINEGVLRRPVRIRNGTGQSIILKMAGGNTGDSIAAGASVTAVYNRSSLNVKAA